MFEAVLDRPLFDKLLAQLSALIAVDEDRVVLYPLCAECTAKGRFLGLAAIEVPTGQEIVFIV